MNDDSANQGHATALDIVSAAQDERYADARDAAGQRMLSLSDDPIVALLHMAVVAKLLHCTDPAMPLEVLVQIGAGVEPDLASLTLGDASEELLDLYANWDDASDRPSAASAGMLAAWEKRPHSAELFEQYVRVTRTLMANLKLQMLPMIAGRRSPDAAERYAIEATRAAVRREPVPGVFGTEYDDQTLSTATTSAPTTASTAPTSMCWSTAVAGSPARCACNGRTMRAPGGPR